MCINYFISAGSLYFSIQVNPLLNSLFITFHFQGKILIKGGSVGIKLMTILIIIVSLFLKALNLKSITTQVKSSLVFKILVTTTTINVKAIITKEARANSS